MALAPRQKRNQRQTVEPRPGPGPVSSADDLLSEVKRAMGGAMTAHDRRQSAAKAWMDAPLQAPAPSGDRGPTDQSYAGHVGEVLGVGEAPGAAPPLLPEAQTNTRLPDPPPSAPPVVASTTRPKGMAGLVFNQHQPAAASSGPARPIFVSVDEPGGRRGGLLGAIRRLFGRQL
jgi:hypothetical protein